MPDISMCTAHSCPLKTECYRYMAKPNPFRQAYSNFSYNEKEGCDDFWQMENSKEIEL